jgi:hypothetical protein
VSCNRRHRVADSAFAHAGAIAAGNRSVSVLQLPYSRELKTVADAGFGQELAGRSPSELRRFICTTSII